jgi:ABC-2 type transport system permease protein
LLKNYILDLFEKVKEIIEYRQLLFRLVQKELKVRYKYPFLGFLWAFIVPLCMIFVFMLIFSYIIKIPSPGYPFFIFLVSALFPWNYLNLSISTSTMSLLDSGSLIKKVYFPREIIPISIVVVNLILFVFSLGLMLIFIMLFGISFSSLIFLLPGVIFVQTIFISGLCLIVSSLQVKYRDIKYIVEILLILWFYLTPIFYPLELVASISNNFLKIYMLNPFTQLITFYRIIMIKNYINILPTQVDLLRLMIFNLVICSATLFLGLIIFKKQEPRFADLV